MNEEILAGGAVAGATVAIVADGRPILLEGYGLADVSGGHPVRRSTVFRVASVSKLVTATAVMRLLEQDPSLSLDGDVRRYLPRFRLSRSYARPFTLRNLLTHTAGFEENVCGMSRRDPRDNLTLEQLIQRHRPAQVFVPASEFPAATSGAYSNWGICLAACLVEERAGMPFGEYVRRNVFQPLGMARSTFDEPLPDAWLPDVARGHAPDPVTGSLAPQPFQCVGSIAPACALSTTAEDMAQFMLAHVGATRAGAARVLSDDSLRAMHARALQPHPAVNGAALAFYELALNGRRLLVHRGLMQCYTAKVALLPEEGLGVFVAVNGGDAIGPIRWVLKRFVDHYYPVARAGAQRTRAASASRYAGCYFPEVRSHTRSEKVLLMFDPMFRTDVEAKSDGRLWLTNAAWEDWAQVGAGVFRQAGEGGQEQVALIDGKLLGAIMPFVWWRRWSWFEVPAFHRAVWAVAALGVCAFLVAAAQTLARGTGGLTYWAAVVTATLGAAAGGAGLATIARACRGGIAAMVFGLTRQFRLGIGLITAGAILAAAALAAAAVAALLGEWPLWQRIHFAGFGVAAAGFCASMHYWNILWYRPA